MRRDRLTLVESLAWPMLPEFARRDELPRRLLKPGKYTGSSGPPDRSKVPMSRKTTKNVKRR